MFFVFRFIKARDKQIYQNLENKKLAVINYISIGYSGTGIFSGIENVKFIDTSGNTRSFKDTNPPVSKPIETMSKVCSIIPFLEVVILLSGILLLVTYYKQDLGFGITALIVVIVLNILLVFLGLFLKKIFIYSIPKNNGWVYAYINSDGSVTTEDEKSGKVVPMTINYGGERKTEMMTEKEGEQVFEAFFGKEGAFTKKEKK